MTHFHLHASNRLEVLAERLAEVLATPLGSPLSPEIVVVQSKGMETWLRMELARHLGISANIVFPFPNRIIAGIFRQVLGLEEDPDFSHPRALTWKVMEAVGRLLDQPQFRDIRAYLEVPPQESKLYQLSSRIAQVFDQYLVFRPDMLLNWEKGKADHWQAILWRHLIGERMVLHKARLKQLFMKYQAEGHVKAGQLPQRISVFGISSLPPYHMQVLGAVAQRTEVNLFLLNPCKEYWGDIIPRQRLSSLKKRAKNKGLDPELMHLQTGNRLLASMGKLGRDFQDIILEFNPVEHNHYVEDPPKTLLSHIQDHILLLREPGEQGKVKIPHHDRSVQIHSCHSPMREMEILKDHLLEMLEQDPGLLPKDIVVMTPDIEAYTPYIQAVFGGREDDPRHIPFTIADRTLTHEGQVGVTLQKILLLPRTRFTASQVLEILETKPVRNRYQISEEDLSLIRNWVYESGIRWGVDETQKEKEGLPPIRENTWSFGLDRLLLGHALPEINRLFKEILSYEKAAMIAPELLGKFSAFLNTLFNHLRNLEEKRTLSNWAHKLGLILEGLMAPDEETNLEYEKVRGVLEELSGYEARGFNRDVGLEVVAQFLKEELQAQGFGFGFLGGGVTFCALVPMRSIPFKVICLVGMNYDTFPRQAKPLQFDLMAQNPRRGDRSKRDDDRYLFLEAILSARDKLYISYVGQNLEDNSAIPPSALVSELIDCIQDGFVPDQDGSHGPTIVVTHRLQGFSPAYFSDQKPFFSYSQENLEGAKALAGQQTERPFVSEELPLPSETVEPLIEDLVEFFKNPSKYFLKRRLGIRLPAVEEAVQEKEPLSVGGLEAYHLEQFAGKQLAALKDNALGQDDYLEEIYRLSRARGMLPHGSLGKASLARRAAEVADFLQRLCDEQKEDPLPPLEVEIALSGITIRGRLDNIYPSFLLSHRLGKIRAKDKIATWVKHLVINTAAPSGYPHASVFIGKGEKLSLPPVDRAQEFLQELAELFVTGLRRPLAFFPETSLTYASRRLKGKNHQQALAMARAAWFGSERFRGEGQDEYFNICYGREDPFNEDFCETALKIWQPFLEIVN